MSGASDSLRVFVSAYSRRRYTILFYTVLLTLLSAPVLSALKWSGNLLESFLAASLLAAILPISEVRSRPYLLAGIYFGLSYWVLERMIPGTFTAAAPFSQTSAIYFSFVTLATLGYGDIAPRGDIARGLAIIEGIGGQLFLAVLVARLVSLYSTPRNQSD